MEVWLSWLLQSGAQVFGVPEQFVTPFASKTYKPLSVPA